MKNQLRNIAKQKRACLDNADASKRIKEILFSLDVFKQAKNIFCYNSFGSEIDTSDYFKCKEKNWFLPKINDSEMYVCPYEKDTMQKNKYGILEPVTKPINDIGIIDLIIIPALCVDKNKYRIGYGKGYYDKFLKNTEKRQTKVVLEYSDLVFENVFPEKHDEKSDIIVTEKGLIL